MRRMSERQPPELLADALAWYRDVLARVAAARESDPGEAQAILRDLEEDMAAVLAQHEKARSVGR